MRTKHTITDRCGVYGPVELTVHPDTDELLVRRIAVELMYGAPIDRIDPEHTTEMMTSIEIKTEPIYRVKEFGEPRVRELTADQIKKELDTADDLHLIIQDNLSRNKANICRDKGNYWMTPLAGDDGGRPYVDFLVALAAATAAEPAKS